MKNANSSRVKPHPTTQHPPKAPFFSFYLFIVQFSFFFFFFFIYFRFLSVCSYKAFLSFSTFLSFLWFYPYCLSVTCISYISVSICFTILFILLFLVFFLFLFYNCSLLSCTAFFWMSYLFEFLSVSIFSFHPFNCSMSLSFTSSCCILFLLLSLLVYFSFSVFTCLQLIFFVYKSVSGALTGFYSTIWLLSFYLPSKKFLIISCHPSFK